MSPDVRQANVENMIVFGVPNRFRYKNWKGETADRHFIPMTLRYGTTPEHPIPQWLIETFDLDKKDYRTYSLAGIEPR